MKKKIYCFNNGGSSGWYSALAICEDGHVLAQHVCSHECFMKHDLGVEGSDWKHDQYDAHCGKDGWETVWVETSTRDAHEGLNAALKLNAALGEEARRKDQEATKAGVAVEYADGSKQEITGNG